MEEEQLKYKVVVDDNNKGAIDECDLVMSRNSSGSSLEFDSFEEAISPTSSSSSADGADPLNDMSSLIQQLPIKRGLSKYYQGKAQSFTSLEKVESLEDLAKPENPYNKKLKPCRSFGGRMDERGLHPERGGDKIIMYRRPPIPSHTSTTTIPNHTALYV